MCLPEIDWNRVKTYVTSCEDKWDEDTKDDNRTALHHALAKHAPRYVLSAIVNAFPGPRMDNYLAERPKVPTKVDLCIAIERAKKADQDTILKSPNTLYSLVKGLMSKPPQVEVIKDAMIKYSRRKQEYYFTLDESGFPKKRIRYSED
jgi:hypothetical protein